MSQNLADNLVNTFLYILISREFAPGDRRVVTDVWKEQVLGHLQKSGITLSKEYSNEEVVRSVADEVLRNISRADGNNK